MGRGRGISSNRLDAKDMLRSSLIKEESLEHLGGSMVGRARLNQALKDIYAGNPKKIVKILEEYGQQAEASDPLLKELKKYFF